MEVEVTVSGASQPSSKTIVYTLVKAVSVKVAEAGAGEITWHRTYAVTPFSAALVLVTTMLPLAVKVLTSIAALISKSVAALALVSMIAVLVIDD